MKQVVRSLSLLSFFLTLVFGRPRFLVIPFERVAFFEDPNLVESAPLHFRIRRSAQFDPNGDDLTSLTGASQAGLLALPAAPLPSTRQRQDPNQSFLDSLRGVGIASAEDQLAGASTLQGSPQGPDYVDYGAYTGKKGAFGWYSDHPVLLGYHHR